LDVGCGGGRTIGKLAALAPQGTVYGVDHSEAAVAASARTNAQHVASGRVQIRHGSVSRLPFEEGTFDLVVAIETHFWWPDLPAGVREIRRVLKPHGRLAIVAEVYKGASTAMSRLAEKHAPRIGMTLLSAAEHRSLLADAGFEDVEVIEEQRRGWIAATARKYGQALAGALLGA
ncbi:MAG TPA: class I SAM-dependent methyltransferase, partial [Vicinamibacterales bacterium]|nr:class I SAM-dependent methyltransferase [Vicinamibacterales bacterium]